MIRQRLRRQKRGQWLLYRMGGLTLSNLSPYADSTSESLAITPTALAKASRRPGPPGVPQVPYAFS